jgi:hypothetical protein
MDPGSAAIEGFFGLIMALDVSNILRLALIGQTPDIIMYTLTVAILGCNLAWGLADALINSLSNYYTNIKQYHFSEELRATPSDQAALALAKQTLMADFGPVELELMDDQALDSLSKEVVRCARAKPLSRPKAGKTELMIGIITVAMNLLFALPILAVYYFITPFGVNLATLLANILGLVLLFLIGYYLDKKVGRHHMYSGMLMALMGFVLLAIIIALGG